MSINNYSDSDSDFEFDMDDITDITQSDYNLEVEMRNNTIQVELPKISYRRPDEIVVDQELLQKILMQLTFGRNIIFHGPGGTGKTTLIRALYDILTIEYEYVVYATATTGIAALNMSSESMRAMTLHSWACIGIGEDSAEKLIQRVMNSSDGRRLWKDTNILIIDEVSMLGCKLFEKLDKIGRAIRNKDTFFGGLQLIVVGDFLQLPPVKDKFVFEHPLWQEADFYPFNFYECKRYDNTDYFNILLAIREARPKKSHIKILYERVHAYDELMKQLETNNDSTTIRPTILFPIKVDVNSYNNQKLDELESSSLVFEAYDYFITHKQRVMEMPDKYKYLVEEWIPDKIELKIGAQVMLKANLDIRNGFVNGSRGVVTDISSEIVTVKFLNDRVLRVKKVTWQSVDTYGRFSRTQIPLILAWATTIHKCQGLTLDYVICDLGTRIFTCGQAYVALSRVRNLQGLFISALHIPSISCSKLALDYSHKLLENHKNE